MSSLRKFARPLAVIMLETAVAIITVQCIIVGTCTTNKESRQYLCTGELDISFSDD